MKTPLRINVSTTWFLLLLSLVFIISSCEEGTPIRDADYPDQLIYMPAAVGGRFVIDDINRRIGDPPVSGYPYKYIVDRELNQFIIPLAAYRSGIDNSGEFMVNIAVNNDTINALITAGDTLSLLPANHYSLTNSVVMPDGEELAKFDLVIDLDFLRENSPDEIFALGVSISSPDRDTNPELSTTIIVIDTKIMKPLADFSFKPSGTDPKTIEFLNNSEMATDYSWDFGDGSEASNEESPSHTYSSSGTYTVTLTAIGITGDQDKATFSTELVIP